MAALTREVREALIDLLTPFMEDERERRAWLRRAVDEEPVFTLIDFSGAPVVFVPHLISKLVIYGKVKSGKQALRELLEVIHDHVGLDKQERIKALLPVIDALSDSEPRREPELKNPIQPPIIANPPSPEVTLSEKERGPDVIPTNKLPVEDNLHEPVSTGLPVAFTASRKLEIEARITEPSLEDAALTYLQSMKPIPPESPRFYMAPCFVSNELYHCFVLANNYWHPIIGECTSAGDVDNSYLRHWVEGRPSDDMRDLPVTNISFRAAQAFANWLSALIAQEVRLPTYKEWLDAASAGRVDWFKDEIRANRVYYFPKAATMHAVEDVDPNPFKIRDLLGNAYDMCVSPSDSCVSLELVGGCYYSTEPQLKKRIAVELDTECLKDASFRYVCSKLP